MQPEYNNPFVHTKYLYTKKLNHTWVDCFVLIDENKPYGILFRYGKKPYDYVADYFENFPITGLPSGAFDIKFSLGRLNDEAVEIIKKLYFELLNK